MKRQLRIFLYTSHSPGCLISRHSTFLGGDKSGKWMKINVKHIQIKFKLIKILNTCTKVRLISKSSLLIAMNPLSPRQNVI